MRPGVRQTRDRQELKATVRGPDFAEGQWESAEDFEQWRTVIGLLKRPLRTLGKNFRSAYCGRKKNA